MRVNMLIAAALPALLLAPFQAAGQEVGDAVTFTGCLAQEEDDEGVEYLLQNVGPEVASAGEIELIPGEEVDLAPHVGHTVEVSGVVVADEDAVDVEDEAEEAEADDAQDLHVRVTGLEHVSASCEAG